MPLLQGLPKSSTSHQSISHLIRRTTTSIRVSSSTSSVIARLLQHKRTGQQQHSALLSTSSATTVLATTTKCDPHFHHHHYHYRLHSGARHYYSSLNHHILSNNSSSRHHNHHHPSRHYSRITGQASLARPSLLNISPLLSKSSNVCYFFTDSDWRAKATASLWDASGDNSSSLKDKSLKEDIRVTPKINKDRKVDPTPPTIGRNFITTTRAMREYALDITDLVDLRKFQRRSPYNNEPPITVYLRKDVEAKALAIWTSWDRLQGELQKRKEKEDSYSDSLLIVKKYNKDYRRLNTPQAKMREDILRKSGRVVMAAIMINGANCLLKFMAWLYTGSHSLFAESIHSLADT